MHVTEIELKNFKTIADLKAEFTGGIYLVTGENEIGKSTLINAIGMLLTGERTDNLLKKGEEKGHAKMTVGEGDEQYTVELRFTEKNPRGIITVEKKDTGLKSSNLTALQGIFKYQDFDAHEFVKWSETAEGRRKQVEVVKSLLPGEVQTRIYEIDNEVLRKKNERKEKNADVKAYGSILDKSGVTPDMIEEYAKPVDIQELAQKKADAATLTNKMAEVKARYDEREQTIKALPEQKKQISDHLGAKNENIDKELAEAKIAYEATVKRLEERRQQEIEAAKNATAALKEQEKEVKDKMKAAKKWLEEQEVEDITELQAKLDKAEEHNAKYKAVQNYLDNKKVFSEAVQERDKMQDKIDGLLSERQELIDKSELPIEGLDFTEDGLTLNGVPFKSGEVSTSQEMEVAAKLIIAKNPTVKVFRVAQGESLGRERLKAIVDFATKHGYQGFIEEVHRGQQELIIEKYKES